MLTDRPVDHSERGSSTTPAVLFIESQSAFLGRHELLEEAPCHLPSILHYRAHRSRAEVVTQPLVETALNSARVGMAFHKPCRHGSFEGRRLCAWEWLAWHAFLPCVDSLLFPTRQRVPRDVALAAPLSQQATVLWMSQPFADPLDAPPVFQWFLCPP